MKITVNNQEVEVKQGHTLEALLSDRGSCGPGIAVAVDNKVVQREQWAAFVLDEGMKVTVIQAVCGG